jgi:hypothetical protein
VYCRETVVCEVRALVAERVRGEIITKLRVA